MEKMKKMEMALKSGKVRAIGDPSFVVFTHGALLDGRGMIP